MKTFSLIALAAAALIVSCTSKDIEGIHTEKIDGVSVSWIRDTPQPKLNPVALFPAAPQSLVDSLGLQDGIPASMSSFLVKDRKGNVALFDTGLGANFSCLGKGLEYLGVKPEDVDYVFITHLHGDHIGGLLEKEVHDDFGASGAYDDPVASQNYVAAFPNATVYVSEEELIAWLEMGDKTPQSILSIVDLYSDRLVTFDYGEELPMGFVTLYAVGHTPGHTVFQRGKLLIVGDIMHAVALQLADPSINAVYDMNPEAAELSRRAILDLARENALVLAGSHFPEPGFLSF